MANKINIGANKKEKLLINLEDNKPVEVNITIGKSSTLDLLIISKAIKNEKHEARILITHESDNSESHIKMYTVAYDEAEVKLYGSVIVKNGTENVSADLKQKAILMSEKAKVVLDPVLEIDDNRLTGSHAAVISSPDPAHLYYLRSRGLSEEESKEMLVAGLLNIPAGYTKIA
jgi:Fe-S cluster assembly protein SufD